MLNRLLLLTYGVAILFTLMAYLSPGIAPSEWWASAFLPFTIPFFLIIHLIIGITLLILKRWWAAGIPVVLCLSGAFFVPQFFAFNLLSPEKPKEDAFSILSYNVRVFNIYEKYHKKNPSMTDDIIRDVLMMEGDIKCFQEFYTEKDSDRLNTIARLSKTHPYYYVEPFFTNHIGGSFGMAIFSKFPIEKTGSIHFKEKTNNQILYADIAVGRNIIRVYNIHLQSMHIDDEELANSSSNKQFKHTFLRALVRYRQGSIRRSKQIEQLVQNINRSPYPVFVCGDLNEPPLGYAYKKMSDLLLNSHEKTGTGIGATYNGQIPFLRIDNIFYQKNVRIHSFDLLKDKTLSDHYPLLGYYSL